MKWKLMDDWIYSDLKSKFLIFEAGVVLKSFGKIWFLGEYFDHVFGFLLQLKAFSASLASPTALDIAADQLRADQSGVDSVERKEAVDREESTVFSQAIHYANRIVYLRVPLDASSSRVRRRRNSAGTDTNSNSILTTSYPESDAESMSEESGFQESDDKSSRDISSAVVKFVTKFVDKVCLFSLFFPVSFEFIQFNPKTEIVKIFNQKKKFFNLFDFFN